MSIKKLQSDNDFKMREEVLEIINELVSKGSTELFLRNEITIFRF